MKQKTKELIDWIKKQINLCGECLVAQPEGCWKDDKDKAFKFLDSLPKIESHLCRGGYILDSKETPCCHGDKVRFKLSHCLTMEKHIKEHGETSTGTLEWNSHIRAFIIRFDNATWGGDWICFDAGNDEIEWFEKVV